MINAVKKAYLLCFSPSGRTTRSEYWLFQLYQLLVIIALIVIAMITIPFNDSTDNIFVAILILFAEIWFLVNIIPNITILIRRLHDTSKSAWWLLLLAFANLGAFALFIFTLLPSDGDNKYGPAKNNDIEDDFLESGNPT